MSGAPALLEPLDFARLDGWTHDTHAHAFAAFRRGAAVLADHPPKSRALGLDARALATVIGRAAAVAEPRGHEDARRFFEAHFIPHVVKPANSSAHFTGYYEPEIAASRTRTDTFRVPFLKAPDELVEIEPGSAPGLDPDMRFARRTADGHVPFHDRGEIMAGALAGRGLEIAWVADPVDAFFAHIQGSARLRLQDGATLRITYAAKSGHAYTSIGRVLRDRGALAADNVTMDSIRAWLAEHRHERDGVLAANRSYIFFREAAVEDVRDGPVAAAKVPLSAGRSLAVDRLLHSFHAPVWVETDLPSGETLRRLMIAQDTGSAIVGPARGDIFFGSGDAAGKVAGAMNAGGRFVLLMPKEAAS